MKRSFLVLLSLTFFATDDVYGQRDTFFVGPSIKVGYEKLGAVRGVAGMLGDNYYVVENDYGGVFDMNNNIKTSVSILSVKDGKFKKRFSLSELVATTNKELNKVLFMDVFIWKDKLIGFYTHKANARTFMANAIICDKEGKLISNIEIGEFNHDYGGAKGGMLNARQKMTVSKSFHVQFNPDSSRLLILASAPADNASNIRFKLYKPGLEFDKDIVANLPLDKKTGELINFVINKAGNVYLVGRTEKNKSERRESEAGSYSHFLYSINTADGNTVKTNELDVPEKAIATVNVALKADGLPICIGFYNNPEAKKAEEQIHGAFTILPPAEGSARLQVNTKGIPDDVIVDAKSSKALKKGEGLDEQISIMKVKPTVDGGVLAFGRYDAVVVDAYGKSGAMNTFQEASSRPTVLSIDKAGKIEWDAYAQFRKSNRELWTRSGRVELLDKGNSVTGFYFGKLDDATPWGLCKFSFDKAGVGKRLLQDKTPHAQWWDILENSLLPLGNGEYVGVTAAGDNVGKDVISLIKFVNK